MSHTCNKCGHDVTATDITNTALIRCAKVIANHIDVNSTAEKLLEILCDFCDAEFSFVYERDFTTNKNELSYIHLSDKSTADFMTFKAVAFDDKNNFSKALTEKPYIFLKNSDASTVEYKVCEEHLSAGPNNNILAIPLKVHDKIVGIVGVSNLERHSEDFELSITISQFLSSVLSIRYTKELLNSHDRELSDVQDLNKSLLKSIETVANTNCEESVGKLLEVICDYFQADRAYCFELDHANKTLSNNFEKCVDIPVSCITNVEDAPYELASKWVNTLNHNDIFYKRVYDLDTSKEEYNFLLSEDIIDLALLPLIYDGQIIGAVGMDNPKRPGNNFDLLKSISTLITNNIKKNNK